VLAGAAHAGGTGRVVGHVAITDADGKPANAEAIIYVVGFKEPSAHGPPAKIAQTGRKFVPDLIAITVGDHVTFPNSDTFLHNVFSQSATRKFDLGSFKKGDAKDKDFPNPGVVDVYCNIHPEMAATILVLPNRRHTRRKPDGSYAIEGVPPGTWTVFAYTRRAVRPASAKVTVAAGQDATVDFSLVRGAEPEHLNKYGEKYHDDGAGYR
jgi:plastocyanin